MRITFVNSEELNWSAVPVQMKQVQMKRTGQQFQFKWKELVNSSSSNERELFEQFQFFERKWNCHTPSSDPCSLFVHKLDNY